MIPRATSLGLPLNRTPGLYAVLEPPKRERTVPAPRRSDGRSISAAARAEGLEAVDRLGDDLGSEAKRDGGDPRPPMIRIDASEPLDPFRILEALPDGPKQAVQTLVRQAAAGAAGSLTGSVLARLELIRLARDLTPGHERVEFESLCRAAVFGVKSMPRSFELLVTLFTRRDPALSESIAQDVLKPHAEYFRARGSGNAWKDLLVARAEKIGEQTHPAALHAALRALLPTSDDRWFIYGFEALVRNRPREADEDVSAYAAMCRRAAPLVRRNHSSGGRVLDALAETWSETKDSAHRDRLAAAARACGFHLESVVLR